MDKDFIKKPFWIRNSLYKESDDYCIYSFEVMSEKCILGQLRYENWLFIQNINCKNKDGLFIYNIKYKYFNDKNNIEWNDREKLIKRDAYYFDDNIIGEILSMLSVFFKARFFILAQYYLDKDDNFFNRIIKDEMMNLYVKPLEYLDYDVFNNKKYNFKDFEDFLKKVKLLRLELYENFMYSCKYFHLALKEINSLELSAEMVYIRLVSAIEKLTSSGLKSYKSELKKMLSKKIDESGLNKEEKKAFSNIIGLYASTDFFIDSCLKYSKGFFDDINYILDLPNPSFIQDHKITESESKKYIKNIYTARSQYLHAGSSMNLSSYDLLYIKKTEIGVLKYDINFKISEDKKDEPIVVKGGFKEYTTKNILPYLHWFERLVNKCISNFLDDLSSQPPQE